MRSSEAAAYSFKQQNHQFVKSLSNNMYEAYWHKDLMCVMIIKQYLFLQGTELISQTLYSHPGLLHLLSGCSHRLVIDLRGHLGIIQLKAQQERQCEAPVKPQTHKDQKGK